MSQVDQAEVPIKRVEHSRNRLSVSAEVFGKFNKPKKFQPPVYSKTPEQNAQIRNTILKCFLFSSVNKNDLNVLIDAFKLEAVKSGEVIIRQNDYGDKLFLIESGTAKFTKTNSTSEEVEFLCKMTSGECFGELALMYNAPRAATVTAESDMELWALDRETFNRIVKDAVRLKREKYDKMLQGVSLFAKLNAYDRCRLADALREESYSDENIVTRGESGTCMYMILSGEAEARVDGKLVKEYKAGDYFGEIALLRQTPRASTVKAKGPCVVCSLERESCINLLGPLEEALKSNIIEYKKVMKQLNLDDSHLN